MDEIVVHPNVPLIGFLDKMKNSRWATRQFLKGILRTANNRQNKRKLRGEIAKPDLSEIYLKHTVRELLYGMNHQLLELAKWTCNSETPEIDCNEKWGVLYGPNGNGSFRSFQTIDTGSATFRRVHELVGYEDSKCWGENENHGLNFDLDEFGRDIHGKDASTIDGFMTNPLNLKDTVRVFREDLKDTIFYDRVEGSVKHKHSAASLIEYKCL